MTKQAIVDKEKCIGCGTCVSLAGKSFKLGDDGKAEALVPAGDDEPTVQSAVDSCPVTAISLKE
ncbi:ferredoxin [Candidatus Beckwithbacteria bacterium CG10_big_fil_rev_8_21_14_0_10_34_10]|uniref:Ferredoxin n=1 Tax=Candidatus Beckwithbacteria bacterium CG10_big_fil_rev_8_21_14_0_10_34_10 TaxID=1974495 RepID=A0A2H0W7W6_9BACT|nr:MAG: ferredoxin [Candidatus Beckwithbacteria bacterium CG10_big_fil_rev_8_21_14_0_10_34_10]